MKQAGMKLARTIRFDRSDLEVFNHAADEGEWAVTGGFSFADLGEDDLTGKIRQAFSNGFMGVPSFGYSTLVSVATASPDDVDNIVIQLADHFISHYGAPTPEMARKAARGEIDFIADICAGHETGTLLSLTRHLGDDGIKESFRAIPKAESCAEQQLWTVVDDDDDDGDRNGNGNGTA